MWRYARLMLAAFVLMSLVGCGKSRRIDLPDVCVAEGSLHWTDGTPVRGGVVQFLMEENSSLSASATTDDAGAFRLRTIYRNHVLDGAREGMYRVEVALPGNDPQGLPITLRLPKAVRIPADGRGIDITIAKP